MKYKYINNRNIQFWCFNTIFTNCAFCQQSVPKKEDLFEEMQTCKEGEGSRE